MFESLSPRLRDVFGSLRGQGRLTESGVETALREIRLALLEADVNFGSSRRSSAEYAIVRWRPTSCGA